MSARFAAERPRAPRAEGHGPERPATGRSCVHPAQDLAREFGAVAVGTFDELLERCDAVVFAVPPDVQAALALRAAQAGKHLLLEKPLAFGVPEAAALAAAVDAAGVATQLVLTYRFTSAVREFLRSVAGAPVRHVRATWIGGGALDGSPFATPWRRAAGAAVLDLGPHTLDLAEAVAGPVRAVAATEAGGVLAVTTHHDGGAVGHDVVRRTIADEFARTVRGELAQPIDVHHGLWI
jgi:predicted dehydrogenase